MSQSARASLRPPESIAVRSLNTPIRVQGTITAEHWVEAYQLASAPSWKGTALVALAIGCTVVPEALRLPNRGEAVLVVIFIMCFGAVVCRIGAMFDCRRAHRHFKNYKPISCEILITEHWVEHCLISTTEAFAWSDFSRYKRSDRLLVLAQRKFLTIGVQIFPRELFETAIDWERFVTLVERKLPRR